MARKKVDAIIGFANNDTVALKNAGIDVINIPILENAQPPLVGVGFGSLADKIQPAVYKKFLGAVEKAVKDAVADPKGAVEITKKYVPSLSETKAASTALAVLEQTLLLYQGDGSFGRQDAATWNAMEKFLADNKILKTPVKASEAYTTAVLEAK
ncbi:ABC transporter substrate-binding protein [Arcanobacterium hippocoleae]